MGESLQCQRDFGRLSFFIIPLYLFFMRIAIAQQLIIDTHMACEVAQYCLFLAVYLVSVAEPPVWGTQRQWPRSVTQYIMFTGDHPGVCKRRGGSMIRAVIEERS